MARMVVIGLALSDCLLILGASVFRGARFDSYESHPVIVARRNARLLLMSIILIATPAVLDFTSTGRLSLPDL
jgi:Ca2+/H+ antiporter